MAAFTLINDGDATSVTASAARDSVRVPVGDLERALGWQLKPEGFCRNDVCYPVPAGSSMAGAAGVDLEAFAGLVGLPLALDVSEGAAFIGVPASDRAAQLLSLEAPDFTLPDLDGRLHSLSDHRGKKVLLAAYASW